MWKTFAAIVRVYATFGSMIRESWKLEDPAATLRTIDSLCPLRRGRTVVAGVRVADQVVTAAQVALEPGQRLADHADAPGFARSLAEHLAPQWRRVAAGNREISHTIVTVVCRDGYVIAGRQEFDWMRAWHYSNHDRDAFAGDVYVVTPHGWTGALDQRAGYEPCLSPVLSAVCQLSQ